MFGYVLPLLCHLKEEDKKRYKASYCGLCNSLKAGYGIRGRFLVNYDMTFLYCLLEREKESGFVSCPCFTKPFCKRDCMPNDRIMAYGADLTVLLSWWKLRDGVADSRGFKKFLYNIGLRIYKKPYEKAARLQQKANDAFREQLERLTRLEQEQCSSIDRVADTFGTLLRGCIPDSLPPEEVRILGTLLYHVGRYLYLVDALEDLPKDQKRGSYNPLCYRYAPVDGKLSPAERESLLQTIEASIDMAASALELLSKGPNTEILENIIYEGMPAVLKLVSEGKFRNRKKFRRRSFRKQGTQKESNT